LKARVRAHQQRREARSRKCKTSLEEEQFRPRRGSQRSSARGVARPSGASTRQASPTSELGAGGFQREGEAAPNKDSTAEAEGESSASLKLTSLDMPWDDPSSGEESVIEVGGSLSPSFHSGTPANRNSPLYNASRKSLDRSQETPLVQETKSSFQADIESAPRRLSRSKSELLPPLVGRGVAPLRGHQPLQLESSRGSAQDAFANSPVALGPALGNDGEDIRLGRSPGTHINSNLRPSHTSSREVQLDRFPWIEDTDCRNLPAPGGEDVAALLEATTGWHSSIGSSGRRPQDADLPSLGLSPSNAALRGKGEASVAGRYVRGGKADWGEVLSPKPPEVWDMPWQPASPSRGLRL